MPLIQLLRTDRFRLLC